MVILVKLFGIVIAGFGVVYLINPAVMKKYISFWAKGNRIYTDGLLSLAIGIMLFLAAAQCKLVWFVILMSIVSLIKGSGLLVLGPAKWTSWINWWTERPAGVLRLLAFLALAIGLLLVYSA